jgi:hypothetical protein
LPRRYGHWQIGRPVTTRALDTRPTAVEVTAQEVLTNNRMWLRTTLTRLRAGDGCRTGRAVVSGYQAHVFKLVQFAVREAVGGRWTRC